MKRNLLALIILLALGGLTFVQFRLLVIGARLEKQRFDQQAVVAQRAIRQALNAPGALSDALIVRLKRKTPPKSNQDYLVDSLQFLLTNKFAETGITARFSFAITPRYKQDVELASGNFDPGTFHFGEYIIPLGDYFSSRLYSEKTLHIDIENLFGYLLKELDYLVIPSVLCLLAILICLAFLINILWKEQKLNRIKNDFINNLTHELKTPAFSISLSAKMAREHLEKRDYAQVMTLLQIIEKENNKLKSHADKVLELASLESARYQFNKVPHDLHKLIGEVIDEYLPKVEDKNGELIVNLSAGQHEARVDEIHVKNTVRNLLDNAIRYSPDKPEIKINTSNDNSYFILAVRDNGVGIAAAHQQLIFDKFYRIPSGEMYRAKGFGLGLSYVKQVVEAHGGKIKVTSREGEGAEFIVSIPLK